jgi:hypothetical protein
MIRGVPSLLMNSKRSFPPMELFQAQRQFRIPKPIQFLSVSIKLLATCFVPETSQIPFGLTFHTTLQATPCQLVFGRDLILDASFTANCSAIVACKIHQAQIYNARENHSCTAHSYVVGDLVLIQLNKLTLPKLACPTEGPYRII